MEKPLTPSYPQSLEILAEGRNGGPYLSDNDLLLAVADGDHEAFAVLMKRHLAGIVNLAQRIIFDREQAQEIAQEAFLRAWQQAKKWDPNGEATFLTWLRRVAVNLAISCRRRVRETVDIERIELPADMADGFDHMAASDQKRAVREALESLPPRQRAAIALFYFDELPQIQAAEIMQMTPRAFDSLIVRARVSLKKYLAGTGSFAQEHLI